MLGGHQLLFDHASMLASWVNTNSNFDGASDGALTALTKLDELKCWENSLFHSFVCRSRILVQNNCDFLFHLSLMLCFRCSLQQQHSFVGINSPLFHQPLSSLVAAVCLDGSFSLAFPPCSDGISFPSVVVWSTAVFSTMRTLVFSSPFCFFC